MNEAWAAMLASVEKRRDVDARFYKPTCLIAVIDGIGDGTLAPSDLDPDRVCARFGRYLEEILPDRANMGWRPFWHLSRDEAWIFAHEGREVGPEDFKRQRKPNSRRELMTRIDRVSVPDATRPAWRCARSRRELRSALIEMLRRDDEACRRVADHLDEDGPLIAAQDEPAGELRALVGTGSKGGQGFVRSTPVRLAVERRAMEVAAGLLEADGWTVEDVSARRSYDLHCTRGRERCFVEVKGTSGPGAEIHITAGEVTFANLHRDQMMLIVVAGIGVEASSDDPIAVGGTPHVFSSWAPEPGDLSPISYFCRIELPA
jgi:hypothetical protein